jgi:hypothetical protein
LAAEVVDQIDQALNRRVFRRHLAPDPVSSAGLLAGLRVIFVQERTKPGKYQRRFAAARTADDGDEATSVEQPVERVDLIGTAEEKSVFAIIERAKPRKRPRHLAS